MVSVHKTTNDSRTTHYLFVEKCLHHILHALGSSVVASQPKEPTLVSTMDQTRTEQNNPGLTYFEIPT